MRDAHPTNFSPANAISHVGCALRTFTVADVGNPTITDSGGNIAVVLKPIAITEIANGARCAPYEFLAR